MKLLIVIPVLFVVLFAVILIKKVIDKKYNCVIRIYNKTIDGTKAGYIKNIINNNNRSGRNKLPSCSYKNFMFCETRETPPKGDYYTYVYKTSQLYKVNSFVPKTMPEGQYCYEEILTSKRERAKLKRIFKRT